VINAIEVRNLSKVYRLGEIGTGTLSRDLHRAIARLMGKEDPFLKVGEANDRARKGSTDIVYSLKDLNFDIVQGDVVGIIGRNGAGKSTLLKILSRVTTPTTGEARIRGRIASLLEVGTGFHPELTGKENIFLNGAILGMRKWEIRKKFDEIVEFSGVERYIDTPVKRYSSGMYVRLAFAVAAHLESEILVVDEVLAVGDAEFQKKCLGKMGEISRGQGRTILFVSHNMAAVKQLCNKGIVLEKGVVVFQGTEHDSVLRYQSSSNLRRSYSFNQNSEKFENDNIRILEFEVSPLTGSFVSISSGILFKLSFFNHLEGINLDVTFELRSVDETIVFHHGAFVSKRNDSLKGVYTIEGQLPPNLINAGVYKFKLIFGKDQRYRLYDVSDFVEFEISNEAFGNNFNQFPGVLRPDIHYNIKFDSSTTRMLKS